MIIQLYSPPIEHRATRETQKSIIFQFNVTDKVIIGAIFSNCVVYNKTIIHLGVGESGGCLPRRFAAKVNIHHYSPPPQ